METSEGVHLTAAYGRFLRPEMSAEADFGVAPLDQAAEPVTPSSPFDFPPLPVLELLPPVILNVSPAPVRSSVGSGFFGSSAPTPSSSIGVGAELALPLFPSPSLSWATELGEKIRSSPHVAELQALSELLPEG